MKTRHLTILFTIIIFILLGTVLLRMPQFAATSRSNEPIPYIYYYSDLHHAWVVERADGSDSRLLGQGVMPTYIFSISAAWSPSGEWLAWWGRSVDMTFTPASAWLVSSDGREISHLLDDAVSITWLEWADDKDWLLVIFRTYEGNLNSHQVVRIIDVPNQRIVAEVRQNGLGEMRGYSNRYIYQTGWAEDNQSVFFMTNGIISRLHINGQVESWHFDVYSPMLDYSRERLVAYLGEGLSITDLSTGEFYLLPENNPDADRIAYAVNWNPVRSHALVTETACTRNPDSNPSTYTCERTGFYVLDWADKTLEALGNDYQVYSYYDDYDYERHLIWSPDGQVAMLRDANKGIYLLDSHSYEIYPLAVENASDWYWSGSNDLIIWEEEEVDIFRFDWSNKNLELYRDLDTPNPPLERFEVSPDGNMIGYYGNEVLVENIESGESYAYPRHSSNTVFGPVYGYQWGENPDWFFSGGNTMYSGSCCNARTIMIHNLHETTGRELTTCYDVDSCVGFLPDAVLPHLAIGQAESHIPAPEQVLLHEGDVIDMSWSPDGSYLSSYSREASNNVISVWDMQETTPRLIQKINTELNCGSYAPPCYIHWLDAENLQFIGAVDSRPNDPSVYMLETINISNLQVGQESWEFQRPYRFLSQDRTYEIVFEGAHNEIGHLQIAESHELLHSLPLELYQTDYYHFDYNPETELFVGGGIYGRFVLWDAASGERLDWAGLTGYAAAFSPDGRQLAVASSEFVTIWDMSEYIENR